MRWVCPRCHHQVSVALTECPYCAPDGAQKAEPPPLPLGKPPPVSTQPLAQRSPASAAPGPAAAAGPLPDDAASIRARFRQTAAGEARQRESPFWHGLKMGVGFMLAVALILFLLALLMTWFFQEGWQPWLDQLWP